MANSEVSVKVKIDHTAIFDPDDCVVVIQTYPTGQAHLDILACLDAKGVPKEAIKQVNARDTIAARNFAVAEYFRNTEKRWAILFDADMQPGPATKRFWEAEGDIVGAYYPFGDITPWGNGSVHCGMMRVDIEVFRTLPPPWFLLTRTPDGTKMTDCECGYFTKRATAAGFSVVQAGYCGHAGKHDGCGQPY